MSNMINNKFPAILGDRLIKISRISKDTGISRTTLTNLYYRRCAGITFEVLDKLCSYLGCTVGDIFEYECKDPTPPTESSLISADYVKDTQGSGQVDHLCKKQSLQAN